MWNFLERVFGGGFMPHGHCYLWTPSMVWTQVISNGLIGLAYLSISSTLAYLVHRAKLPFSWVYIAFGVFILACGMTHFLDVATVWHPIYWADAAVRVVTAVASVGTAILIFPLVPKVLALSKVSALAKERGEKLEVAVSELRRTIDETTRYRLLVESVKDATFILDPKGNVTSWNAGAERIQGYTAHEIIGKSVAKFYPPEEVAERKLEEELERARAHGLFEVEAWRVRKDGSRFWANVSTTAMHDEAGAVVGFAKVVRDLTEHVAAEEKLRNLAAENARLAEQARTQEFQERFLAILGHDLRNPLAAIAMGTALLKQRPANDVSSTRILGRMESSTARMSRMIEQILDLTRSRLAGGLEMNPAPIDLCDTLHGIVDEVRTAHPSRTIDLRCSSLHGTWDADRLEQVFSNLVSNAIHHGLADRPVTIEARQDGSMVSVSVHNDGPPIAEELLTKLFDPFRRGGRDSRTAKTAGLGLGLYISREIVVAQGGTIDVQSTSSGGTTFHVFLPLTSAALPSI